MCEPRPDDAPLRVGELAARTGLTVRALHHYDEIDLLRPSRRTASGHRLYAPRDVARLWRIRALQQLGFPLEEIRSCLDGDQPLALQVLDMQLARVRSEAEAAMHLCARLERLRDRLRSESHVSVAEFLETLEEMTMFEKYYTPEQMKRLEARREALGDDTIKAVEAEWPRLITAVREEMSKGTDPADPKVRQLAARWQELVAMFTGGDAGIAESCRRLYAGEPHAQERSNLDSDVMSYVARALDGSQSP